MLTCHVTPIKTWPPLTTHCISSPLHTLFSLNHHKAYFAAAAVLFTKNGAKKSLEETQTENFASPPCYVPLPCRNKNLD